ncbi:MAG: hypothetical protein WCF78_00645 [archaeon]
MSNIKIKLINSMKNSFNYEIKSNNLSSLKTISFYTQNPEKYEPLLKTYLPTFFKLFISSRSHFERDDLIIYNQEIIAHLDNVLSKPDEYRKKLLKEMSTLKQDKFSVFLESERYYNYVEKKYNPFLEIIRIKNGLITQQVISNHLQDACALTLEGFLRAIKSKAIRFIKADINGKEKILIVKTKTGTSNTVYVGINKLGIDPETLNIYKITNSLNKITKKPNYITQPVPLSIYIPNQYKVPSIKSNTEILKLIKPELDKYIAEAYSKENLNKTKKEMTKFIKRNKKLFERKPIKPKAL